MKLSTFKASGGAGDTMHVLASASGIIYQSSEVVLGIYACYYHELCW